MGDFFRSTKFKVLAVLLAVLIGFMFLTAYLGGRASPLSQALGVITVPIQKLSSAISGAAVGFFEKYLDADELYAENERLREEIRVLRQQQVNFEEYKRENEHYKQVLGLKEQNPAFEFATAEVIGRDPNDRFYGFTIDKGTLHGVKLHNPVITPEGLIGWISEAGLNYAKVTTILDVSLDVGAVDARTRDIGVLSGDVTLAANGKAKLSYLTRESAVTAGDIIETSGLGDVLGVVFPKGLIIGTVDEVRAESNGITLYAVVTPSARVTDVKDVFVLTYFPGQGAEAPAIAAPGEKEAEDGTAHASSSGASGAASSTEGGREPSVSGQGASTP